MDKKHTFPWHFLEQVLPWLVLVILVMFSYAKFVEIPYAGIRYEPDGRIVQIFVTPSKHASLELDDKLLKVGTVSWEEYTSDLESVLFDDVEIDQEVPLMIRRDGQTLSIPWRFPGFNQAELLERLNSEWWWSYIFWFAGMVTIFVVRPRNVHRRLLVSFFFLTSLWLAAGSLSTFHIWHGAKVLRALIWLCVPVYLHLHWSFPESLGRLPALALWGTYIAAIALAIAEVFQVLPKDAFYFGFLLAAVGSVGLLIGHYIFKPQHRSDVGLLAVAVLVILIPPILYITLEAFDILSPLAQGGAMLGFPALPGAYFFATYRRQLRGLDTRLSRLPRLYLYVVLSGFLAIIFLSMIHRWTIGDETTFTTGLLIVPLTLIMAVVAILPFFVPLALRGTNLGSDNKFSGLELRANRLLPSFLFGTTLGILLTVPIIIADILLQFPGSSTLIGIVAAITASVITHFGYLPMRRFVEFRLLSIPLPPDHLVEIYSERIITSLNLENLKSLIQDELLPSLLVRQSALLRVSRDILEPVVLLGLEPEQLPEIENISALTAQVGVYRPLDDQELYPWARLILSLIIAGELRGLWLLGRRDPDDYYAPGEIEVLKTIANQTAIALVNIEQAERLRALHQANIERHEQERANLAHDLHDDVLNQLAAFTMKLDSDVASELDNGFRTVNACLRRMISGLRPAMLNYGLAPALEELADELTARYGSDVDIQVEIAFSGVQYDSMVEAHLYRIVQQACENALRHAQASIVQVNGNCDPEGVQISVADDGIGFAEAHQLDFNKLLADKHYGIAGMFERAEIIGADLSIDSKPGEGTKVNISWHSHDTGGIIVDIPQIGRG